MADLKILAPSGEMKNKSNHLLKYKKEGQHYEFNVYNPSPGNRINYKCKTKNCPIRLNYGEFIDYLYDESYIDNKFEDGGTIPSANNDKTDIKEQIEQRLQQQQANKEFKDVGRVAQTRKEKSAYKLISAKLLTTLEEDAVMAYNMVKKENVWPEINIDEERQKGTTSGAAFLKVKIRESVPTRPKDSKDKRATYVLFLELLQKDLLECYDVKQITDLIYKYRSLPMDKVIGYFINPEFLTADEETKEKIKQNLKSNKNLSLAFIYGGNYLVSKLLNEIFGARFENIFFNKSDATAVTWNEAKEKEPISEDQSEKLVNTILERKESFIKSNTEKIELYKSKTHHDLIRAMETEWQIHSENKKRYKSDPELFRAWVIKYLEGYIKKEDSRWENKIKKSEPRDNDWSWTTKETKSQDKPKAQAINTKAPLAYIKRTGGYKIDINSPQEIIDSYGFNAVNYGVYVDDKWSKEHTKHFLGAMSDLGEILNIDIKQINQLGKLSIAFGAKGRKGHLATYFPQTKDINLTKGKGDGSVAHEWGHYFDNVIVELDEHKAINGFASQGISSDISLRILFKDLFDFINKGNPAITPRVPMRFYAKASEIAPSYIANGTNQEIEIKETIEETLLPLDSFCIVNPDRYQTQLRVFGYIIDKFGLESHDVPMKLRTSYYYHKSAYSIFQYCYKSETSNSVIAADTRTKYWTDPVELFARAWETMVLKKFLDAGRVSNYLVDDIPMEDIISESYYSPYPSGKELEYIETLIDKIVIAVKSKYNIDNFIPPSNIKEDEYLDLNNVGEVTTGIVVIPTNQEIEMMTLDQLKERISNPMLPASAIEKMNDMIVEMEKPKPIEPVIIEEETILSPSQLALQQDYKEALELLQELGDEEAIVSLEQDYKDALEMLNELEDEEPQPKESYVINYMNKDNGFRETKKHFHSYEEAKEWGKSNLGNFHSDMIKPEFKDGGVIDNPLDSWFSEAGDDVVTTKDGHQLEKHSNKYRGHIFFSPEDDTEFLCLGYIENIQDCAYVNLSTKEIVVGCVSGFKYTKGGEVQSTEVQSLIFHKDNFTKSQAKDWALKHNFIASKFDETADTIRVRQHQPIMYDKKSFRTIDLTKGIQAIIAKPKKK